jgi:predicted transcriptional regulator
MSDRDTTKLQNEREDELEDSAHFTREAGDEANDYSLGTTNRRQARAKYRSRVDILCAILSVSAEGARKSEIKAYAYVASPQIKEYMNLLLDNDMLKYNTKSRKYYTTEKGHRLTKLYDEAKMIFNPDK